jgi:hypothetical protein
MDGRQSTLAAPTGRIGPQGTIDRRPARRESAGGEYCLNACEEPF